MSQQAKEGAVKMGRLLAYLSLVVPMPWLPTRYIIHRMRYFAADPQTCEHEWEVVASILSTVELQVQCCKCLTYSEVPKPSEEEWSASFGAMSKAYPWPDRTRVTRDRLFVVQPTEEESGRRTFH